MVSITGRFNCAQMSDEQLKDYLLRVRGLYVDLVGEG